MKGGTACFYRDKKFAVLQKRAVFVFSNKKKCGYPQKFLTLTIEQKDNGKALPDSFFLEEMFQNGFARDDSNKYPVIIHDRNKVLRKDDVL